jgi:hypothetical protein
MKDKNRLLECIGKSLVDGRLQMLEVNGKQVNFINVVFLKFDITWLRIRISDESVDVRELEDINECLDFTDGEFGFCSFGIAQKFKEFENLLGQSLLKVYELKHKTQTSFSFGIKIILENESCFIIRNTGYPNEKLELYFEEKIFDDLVAIEI